MSTIEVRLRDHRRATAVVVLVVVVAAIAITVVVVRSLDRSPRAQVGEVWTDRSVDLDQGSTASVEIALPDRELRLVVGAPRERLLAGADALDLDDDTTEDPETLLRAPEGGVFVPIDLAPENDEIGTAVSGPTPAPEVRQDAVPDPTIEVVTAGEDVDVGAQLTNTRALDDVSTSMVALPGDGAALTVRIVFDGEAQEVDVDVEAGKVVAQRFGRFAVYDQGDTIDEPRLVPAEVGDGFSIDGGRSQGLIAVGRAVRVPWVAGLGWAAEDESWLSLDLYPRRSLQAVRGPLATLVDGPDFTAASYRLGDDPAVAVAAASGPTPYEGEATIVFATPATGPLDDVDVELELPLRDAALGADPPGSAPTSVPVSWTVPLPVTG